MIQLTQKMQADSTLTQCHFSNEEIIQSSTRVCVIVPVRNEAGLLSQTLQALRLQMDPDGNALPQHTYEVLLLINNSTDHSLQIATAYARKFPAFRLLVENIELPHDQAHIGTARRMLMDKAYARLTREGNQDGIIASTDGDTSVDSQWVYHIMAEIGKGNDAVGGRILTRKRSGSERIYHLRDVTYRCLLTQAESLIDPQVHNPFPCHFQYFGANMAVTCKMYEQAGRLPVLPFLEDAAFHKALLQQDARIRKSFTVKVYTSARINGRVSIGFSQQLGRWKEEQKTAQAQMVEEVAPLLRMYSLRNRLRKCWSEYQKNQIVLSQQMQDLASLLHTPAEWLQSELTTTASFGLLWESIQQRLYTEAETAVCIQPIEQAILQLRKFINDAPLTVFGKNPAGMSLHAG